MIKSVLPQRLEVSIEVTACFIRVKRGVRKANTLKLSFFDCIHVLLDRRVRLGFRLNDKLGAVLDQGCTELERDDLSVRATRLRLSRVHVWEVLKHACVDLLAILAQTVAKDVERGGRHSVTLDIDRLIL